MTAMERAASFSMKRSLRPFPIQAQQDAPVSLDVVEKVKKLFGMVQMDNVATENLFLSLVGEEKFIIVVKKEMLRMPIKVLLGNVVLQKDQLP